MIPQTRVMEPGMSGGDVYAMKRALRAWAAKTGRPSTISWPVHNMRYGGATDRAVDQFQSAHSIEREPNRIGPNTYRLLWPYCDRYGRWLLKRYATKHAPMGSSYPLAVKGEIIGVPYQGTHADFGNWESDNAVDITARTGTPVLAVRAGTIGPQIGPLDTGGNPQLLGQRLHLVADNNEWYYAHLSVIDVHAGDHVQAGQRLGLSGSANGVEHLHFAQEHGDPGLTVGSPTPGYVDRHYPG
jgi:murein DD-endopeptidase MepM/ murein hydrolase activator NlpD